MLDDDLEIEEFDMTTWMSSSCPNLSLATPSSSAFDFDETKQVKRKYPKFKTSGYDYTVNFERFEDR